MISAVWNPLLVKMVADAGYDFIYIDHVQQARCHAGHGLHEA
jgi:hypothetical protein